MRKYIKFGFLILIPAYFTILANSVMNRHTHVTPDGYIITHAHPYAKDVNGGKTTNHHHSIKSIYFFQAFCVDFYAISNNNIDFNVYPVETGILNSFTQIHVELPMLNWQSSRAPPVWA